ncbi:hypothetical protein [Parasphingorhabdus sp.]|uniref:hypothetical protein n=1 Tax=Parasphingorhabdus sp. TaxID=2709688 RepID=UPI0032650D82
MRARKIRYDETFVEAEPAPDTGEIQLIGSGEASYVPSPARQLQEQLEGRLSETGPLPTEEKLSPRTKLLIIVGSCAGFWATIVAAGFLISMI